MASLYKRKKSPYWWIKYVDDANGTQRESTELRIGIGGDTVKARQIRDKRSLEESMRGHAKAGEQWAVWVDEFFKRRYADSPGSLLRARNAWRNLAMYLDEIHVTLPRQLTREQCIGYMAWRQKPNRKLRKYRASHNTSHLELKFLGIVMAEAVKNKYVVANLCRDLDIERMAIPREKKKPAFTDAAVELIRASINAESRTYVSVEDETIPLKTFLNNSFELAYYHGCRLAETHLDPMRDVEFFQSGETRRARITFSAKGNKQHTVYLHPKLFPLFDELRSERKHETYPKPKSPAKEWFNFLTRIGLKKEFPRACFHSLRVTAATKFARAGVSKKKAMEYIGHASATVHDSYVRLEPEDLDECIDAIT